MSTHYKIWLTVEEIDEEKDHYSDIEEHTRSAGVFKTSDEARKIVKSLGKQGWENSDFDPDEGSIIPSEERSGVCCGGIKVEAGERCPVCGDKL